MFANATGYRAACTFQPTISASEVRRLHHLEPLTADTKDTKDSTQIRLSHGMWKVKTKPGERVTRGATRHINTAIAQHDKLLKVALISERLCKEIPAGLLSTLRTPGTTALTVGQLRAEFLAIRLHDRLTVLLEMAPDRALALVHQAIQYANTSGGIDLEADLIPVVSIMVRKELDFQAALRALKAERDQSESEQGAEAESTAVTYHPTRQPRAAVASLSVTGTPPARPNVH